MQWQNVFCLHVKGISLRKPMLQLLGQCSWQLYNSGDKYIAVRGRQCDGSEFECVVQTDRQPASFGGITGIAFTADISIESRQAQTSFIIRRVDLEAPGEIVDTCSFCACLPADRYSSVN